MARVRVVLMDKRISWGEYISRLYDTDEIELLIEEEVVRCKDCMYCCEFAPDLFDCEWWGAEKQIIENLNGFCAWGEKVVSE